MPPPLTRDHCVCRSRLALSLSRLSLSPSLQVDVQQHQVRAVRLVEGLMIQDFGFQPFVAFCEWFAGLSHKG